MMSNVASSKITQMLLHSISVGLSCLSLQLKMPVYFFLTNGSSHSCLKND